MIRLILKTIEPYGPEYEIIHRFKTFECDLPQIESALKEGFVFAGIEEINDEGNARTGDGEKK